jgi:hypothetical protein
MRCIAAGGPWPHAVAGPWDSALMPTFDSYNRTKHHTTPQLEAADNRTLARLFRQMQERYAQRSRNLGEGQLSARAVLRRVRSAGVSIGSWGCDFSRMRSPPHAQAHEAGDAGSHEQHLPRAGHGHPEDLNRSLQLLYGGVHQELRVRPLSKIFWEEDWLLRTPRTTDRGLQRAQESATSCFSSSSSPSSSFSEEVSGRESRRHVGTSMVNATAEALAMLKSLRVNGFAAVRDWRSFGVDIDSLSVVVERSSADALNSDRGAGVLEPLEPLLRSSLDFHWLLNQYMGAPKVGEPDSGGVRYDGHLIKNTTAVWSRKRMSQFPAGRWHHDRCGRRIKAFVYLSDVTSESHPTLIAAGTHETLYYTHDPHHIVLSRYSDAAVRHHHVVHPMLGRRGGGFLFDTNVLHRIDMDGTKPRLLLALEFHPRGKIKRLRGSGLPCPSRSRDLGGDRGRSWKLWGGARGYPLYPHESA